MGKTVKFIIREPADINRAFNWADPLMLKALEVGPVQMTLGRTEQRRGSEVNAKFHAMIADIQAQAVIPMPGRRIVMSEFDMDACKALLVVWFAREREMNGEPLSKPPRSIVDPTTGERVQIRPSTAEWGKRDASDFIEFLYSVGSDGGVRWSEPALAAYEEYKQAQEK